VGQERQENVSASGCFATQTMEGEGLVSMVAMKLEKEKIMLADAMV